MQPASHRDSHTHHDMIEPFQDVSCYWHPTVIQPLSHSGSVKSSCIEPAKSESAVSLWSSGQKCELRSSPACLVRTHFARVRDRNKRYCRLGSGCPVDSSYKRVKGRSHTVDKRNCPVDAFQIEAVQITATYLSTLYTPRADPIGKSSRRAGLSS